MDNVYLQMKCLKQEIKKKIKIKLIKIKLFFKFSEIRIN